MLSARLFAQDTSATESFNDFNAQTYTPSNLLSKGQVNVQLFNNLYTQTAFRDNEGNLVKLNNRSNYFGSLLQVFVGVDKKNRINVGFDVNFKSVRIDANENSSPFKVLLFESNNFSRTAITSVGPKIKWAPFKKLPDFSVQTSFWIPLKSNSESNPWLDYNRYTSWTQIFYSHMLNSKFQFFYELDAFARIKKESAQNNQLSTPATFIVSYFPTSKLTFYSLLQYSPFYTYNKGVKINSYYAQAGLGAKYQISKTLQLELLYTDFFASRGNGAGTTYNLGIRYLH